jgi:2-amino-4-hydroxy-6-hydroxymethyldihydropteridine diphosphokinase
MTKAYLSLGSNMGAREDNLKRAVDYLDAHESINVKSVSAYYETEPWGYTDQEAFLNIALGIETALSPEALLGICQEVEEALKRVRKIHWGPRTIDVDILTYGAYTSQSAELTIPHPRMTERGFVLVPLAEIAPELIINGKKVLDWLSEVDQTGIRKI